MSRQSQPIMLAGKIVTMAHKNDSYKANDDISCATIYFREPRKLLICTGPPYEKEKDKELASKVLGYKEKLSFQEVRLPILLPGN